ncbi:MAG: hypothetical protein VKJ64_13570 [Leptolyngbyaceae bacterium]|nr:hypothetical protein [Leptolyngbyaceae bacterium]
MRHYHPFQVGVEASWCGLGPKTGSDRSQGQSGNWFRNLVSPSTSLNSLKPLAPGEKN